MTIAVYALSGDPITYGHLDIIKRSASLFDKLIVGLGVNPNKKYTLTSEERLNVAQKSLSNIENVQVMFFEGLLVDFAFEQGAKVIIRGIRNATDVTDEQSLDQVNSSQMDIDTLLMFSKSKFVHISSSNVKALQKENGLIHEYVPLPVKKILEKKISDQLIYGITGVMGSGKSYVAEQLVSYSKKLNDENSINPLVHNIELDKLAHEVYDLDKPAYKNIRDQIYARFKTLERFEIGQIAFGSKNSDEHVAFLNDLFRVPVMVLLRQAIRDKKGIILINSALLVESNMLNICNNHVVLVNAETSVRHARLSEFRKIDPIIAENRIKHMKTNKDKELDIKYASDLINFGNIISFDNSRSDIDDIASLYEQLKNEYNK